METTFNLFWPFGAIPPVLHLLLNFTVYAKKSLVNAW